MELNRCSRCGSFYVSEGNVCPKCSAKDGFEFSTFKTYVEEKGFNVSLDTISEETGISTKNLNRFVNYDDFKPYKKDFNDNTLKNLSDNLNTNLYFNG